MAVVVGIVVTFRKIEFAVTVGVQFLATVVGFVRVGDVGCSVSCVVMLAHRVIMSVKMV